MNTTLDKMECDLTSILTPHSRGSTVLMFRNSGSSFLGILGDYRKAVPSPDSQGKFLSNWLILPTLDPRKCDTFQVLSLSSSLLGNVKQCTRRFFHKNWCPQELGFMLEMKFPSCPSVIWGLQWGLAPGTDLRQAALPLDQSTRMPNPPSPPRHILAFILQGLS